MSEQAPCTKEDAIAAVKAQAFEVTDEESSEFCRRLVHCFAGGLGADWNEDAVIDYIENASELAWVDHWMKHDLGVRGDHGVRYFDIKSPERQP